MLCALFVVCNLTELEAAYLSLGNGDDSLGDVDGELLCGADEELLGLANGPAIGVAVGDEVSPSVGPALGNTDWVTLAMHMAKQKELYRASHSEADGDEVGLALSLALGTSFVDADGTHTSFIMTNLYARYYRVFIFSVIKMCVLLAIPMAKHWDKSDAMRGRQEQHQQRSPFWIL